MFVSLPSSLPSSRPPGCLLASALRKQATRLAIQLLAAVLHVFGQFACGFAAGAHDHAGNRHLLIGLGSQAGVCCGDRSGCDQ